MSEIAPGYWAEDWGTIFNWANSSNARDRLSAQMYARIHLEICLRRIGYSEDELRNLQSIVGTHASRCGLPDDLTHRVTRGLRLRNKAHHRGVIPDREFVANDVRAIKEYCDAIASPLGTRETTNKVAMVTSASAVPSTMEMPHGANEIALPEVPASFFSDIQTMIDGMTDIAVVIAIFKFFAKIVICAVVAISVIVLLSVLLDSRHTEQTGRGAESVVNIGSTPTQSGLEERRQVVERRAHLEMTTADQRMYDIVTRKFAKETLHALPRFATTVQGLFAAACALAWNEEAGYDSPGQALNALECSDYYSCIRRKKCPGVTDDFWKWRRRTRAPR